MPQVDVFSVLAVFIAIGTIYLLGMVLVMPIKLIIKLIINSIIGAVVLYVINLIGAPFEFILGINPITALLVGFLGIPGVILLIFAKLFM